MSTLINFDLMSHTQQTTLKKISSSVSFADSGIHHEKKKKKKLSQLGRFAVFVELTPSSLGLLPFIWDEAGDGEEEDGDEFCEGGERVPFSLNLNLADCDGEVDLSDE